MGMMDEGKRGTLASLLHWVNNKMNIFFFWQIMNGLEIDLFLGSWTTANIFTLRKHMVMIYLSILLLAFLVVFYLAYVVLTFIFGIRRIRLGISEKNKAKITPKEIVNFN